MTGGLVVNADDLGLTEGVNRATVRAHVDGVVTSTSLLAVGRAFDHAVGLLREHPGLDVGAHLALVGEDPPLLTAGEIPSLVDRRGRFPLSYRGVLARAAVGRLDRADVRRELAAQLERILATGVPVTHLDTHQHLHLWPSVAAVVAELAVEHDVRSVRVPTSRRRGPTGLGVRLLSGRLRRRLRVTGRWCTSTYAGLDEAGRMDTARFAAAVAAVAGAPSAEVNVHPGEPADPDLGRFEWQFRWADELAALTDPSARAAIDAAGLELTTFGALAGAGR